jgi:hypothetical protein
MLVEQLNELQQKLAAGQSLDSHECTALITELWRLKASVASKLIERDVAREDLAKVQAAQDEIAAALDAAQRELAELKAIRELTSCPLEGRWSNCAVRMRKQAANPRNHGGS